MLTIFVLRPHCGSAAEWVRVELLLGNFEDGDRLIQTRGTLYDRAASSDDEEFRSRALLVQIAMVAAVERDAERKKYQIAALC